jgi:NAD(P)H-hydrate epimerase
LSEAVRDPFPEIFAAVNGAGAAVLAVDLPSGLDCDSGRALGACIKADRTITFVAPKIGFVEAEAKRYLGDVVVGDIGCPPELIEAVAQELP